MADQVNKSCPISCRVTDDEYAPHVEPIAASGLKPARYFRDLVLSRSLSFEESKFDKERMLAIFDKAGHVLNQVAYLANSAPYKGPIYQSQYLHWLNRLTSIQFLLQSSLPDFDPPKRVQTSRDSCNGSSCERSNKIHIIRFRLTANELAQFDQLIKRAGCSVSAFFRMLVLNNSPVFKEFTGFSQRIIFLVNKAGNNVAQLAYVAKAASERGIITDGVRDKWYESLSVIETILLMGIEYGY